LMPEGMSRWLMVRRGNEVDRDRVLTPYRPHELGGHAGSRGDQAGRGPSVLRQGNSLVAVVDLLKRCFQFEILRLIRAGAASGERPGMAQGDRSPPGRKWSCSAPGPPPASSVLRRRPSQVPRLSQRSRLAHWLCHDGKEAARSRAQEDRTVSKAVTLEGTRPRAAARIDPGAGHLDAPVSPAGRVAGV
jgi:hypothetical protein